MEINKNQQMRVRIFGVMAILILLAILCEVILRDEKCITGKYKYVITSKETSIEWPWRYLTSYEKYGTIDFENIKYSSKSIIQINNTEVIEEFIGTCKVYGKDEFTNECFEENVEVFSLRGISKEALIAVKIDDEFYVYANANINKPQTLGGFLEKYSLQEYLSFEKFSICNGYKENGHYKLSDDFQIWKILTECESAKVENIDDFFDEEDKNYLSFTVTSDALGVYKRGVYISEDGYFATNILDFASTYYIGEKAALTIIKYAKENSVETEFEPYEQTIAGILIEKNEGFILVDDSDLCVNEQDGKIYKLLTDDIRIKRCMEFEDVQMGDIVVISYYGNIIDDNEISGAYSMHKGMIDGVNIVIRE